MVAITAPESLATALYVYILQYCATTAASLFWHGVFADGADFIDFPVRVCCTKPLIDSEIDALFFPMNESA